MNTGVWRIIVLNQLRGLIKSLNAKCIYTCMLTKQELSASSFMQCCVLNCVDQNHFEYAILTCM